MLAAGCVRDFSGEGGMIRSAVWLLLFTAVAAGGDPHAALETPEAGQTPDYNRDVRPILSEHCFKCHGPDPNTREAGLRLDTFEAATEDYGGYAAVTPGDADASEVIARVTSGDADLVMPPPHVGKPVSAEKLDVLRRWIAAGAAYDRHWAFVPPERPPLPDVSDPAWCRTPIDRFVMARLDAEGLRPSAEASRESLARRVSLDLTGLPPTVEELDAFLADGEPGAYGRLVDRLLASPHYGERWARRWLDVARYADTNGYEKDRPRTIWPYRDWVINALNAGLPYDEFTVRQLAGDMLPEPTRADLVATGFHRNTMINEEGGSDPLEYRFHAMVDRTNTTGTAWLGLTVGCAQCHTHKYDPLLHDEYYGLMAFFDGADEPTLPLPDAAHEAKRAAAEAKLAEREAGREAALWRAIAGEEGAVVSARRRPEWDQKRTAGVVTAAKADAGGVEPTAAKLARAKAHAETRFARWVQDARRRASRWTVLEPAAVDAKLAYFEPQPDGSLLAQGDMQKEDWYEITVDLPADARALRLEALPDERLPSGGPGRVFYEGPTGDFMLSGLSVSAGERPLPLTAAGESYAKTWLSRDQGAALAVDDDPVTGWSVTGRPGERHAAVFRFEGPVGERPTPGVPPLGAPELVERLGGGTPGVSPQDTVRVTIRMDFFRHYAATLGRFRWSATADENAAATGLTDEETAALLADGRTDAQRSLLKAAYLRSAPELASLNESLRKARRALPRPDTTLVMRERPAGRGRETRLRHRGEYTSPRHVVRPTVPAALGGWPEGVETTRLNLARWLVSEDNPLAARVKVNRDWQAFFGTGLVKTLEDFGSQGHAPSHPRLLDWLAVEFRESGWDVKALHRLIVTSAGYRQASEADASLVARDPDNRLLARGPSRRLDAEEIRDAVLTASGLLTRTVGGPSVFPPQPAVVAKENFYAKFTWDTETGPDRYRRGLYTFAKRTNPYAMFGTFDAPTGQVCVFTRGRSNTPLQALTLLNDTVVVEAARHLGRELAGRSGSDEERAALLFKRALSRAPAEGEAAAVAAFVAGQRSRLEAGDLSAAELMAGVATASEAAWYLAARAVLNTDEFIVKR